MSRDDETWRREELEAMYTRHRGWLRPDERETEEHPPTPGWDQEIDELAEAINDEEVKTTETFPIPCPESP